LNATKTLSTAWTGDILALIAGALVTLSLAPFDLWPFGIVSTAIIAWLMTDLAPGQAAKRGWFYGLGLFGSGTSWVYVSIHIHGSAPIPLAAFLTLLFTALLALLLSATFFIYSRWLRDKPTGRYLGFAAVLVLGEWFRSWFLTGFPWLLMGYSHLETPLMGWAPVGGIYTLSFITALTGAVIASGLQQRQWQIAPITLVTLLWLSGAIISDHDWVSPTDKQPVKVALVQANIPQQVKWNASQYQPTLDLYQQLSAPLWATHDLVIWPEAAIPGFYYNARGFFDHISQLSAANASSMITGIPTVQPATADTPYQYHSSIMGFGDGGGIYHKQRLVPFGEYVPLEGILRGLITFFDLPMSSFSPGPPNQRGITAGGLNFAPLICYEIVYPGLVAEWFPKADMIVTVSNDAWFGSSIGPLQHLQMAQMRALENGRYVLRSTSTGISAIIDQHGKIVVSGGQFTREVISGEARVFSGATPFAVYGSWPIVLLLLAICFCCVIIKPRRLYPS